LLPPVPLIGRANEGPGSKRRTASIFGENSLKIGANGRLGDGRRRELRSGFTKPFGLARKWGSPPALSLGRLP
jgi:hypothetical protein